MASLSDLPIRDDLRGLTPYGAPQKHVRYALNVNENTHPIPEAVARDIVTSLAHAVLTANRYPDREFTVLSQTDLGTPKQFNDMVIRKTPDGYLVRLNDIGYAQLGALDESRIVRISGNSAVAVGIVRQSTANPLDISKAVRERLPQIAKSLPEGMKIAGAVTQTGTLDAINLIGVSDAQLAL